MSTQPNTTDLDRLEAERAAFEAAFKLDMWQKRPHAVIEGDYADQPTQCAWNGWLTRARRSQPVAATQQAAEPVACRGCDPAEGFCRECREAEKLRLAAPVIAQQSEAEMPELTKDELWDIYGALRQVNKFALSHKVAKVARAATKAAAPAGAHSRDCGNRGCTGCADPGDLARELLAPDEDAREEGPELDPDAEILAMLEADAAQEGSIHEMGRAAYWIAVQGWMCARRTSSVPAIPGTGREKDSPQPYTCIGKGGTYELLGIAKGAGTVKLAGNMTVYRDTEGGQLYYRAAHDFNSRMERIAAAPHPSEAKAGEDA